MEGPFLPCVQKPPRKPLRHKDHHNHKNGAEYDDIVVVENTPRIHNLIVCTLCSCYPWPVLGLPPVWYKSAAYRSRAVSEPREVLQEFGVPIGPEVEVRVWDSTAETRYLVLPMRPEGSQGLDEEALAERVTRNSMIGTGILSPVVAST